MTTNRVIDHNIVSLFEELHITERVGEISSGTLWWKGDGERIEIKSPVDDISIGSVSYAIPDDYNRILKTAQQAFAEWKNVPAPRRGEIVRQFGQKLRHYKDKLGMLVSYEMGKSLQEGLGEVQEMIDICDFATGLSRQLHGLQMHSEREQHRMLEQWHPLGLVGIISAFNFPVAVWAWNATIAWVCGNVCIWKPSEKTPFTAIICQKIFSEVMQENALPEGLSCLIMGNAEIGKLIAADKNINLVSATGSTKMGVSVATAVAQRLGKSILELGGNNAIILTLNADIKQAIPAIVFGACGTAGQRCTTTRRLLVHDDIYDNVVEQLRKAYAQIKVGNPLDERNHMGPLIDSDAVDNYFRTLEEAKQQGGRILFGGALLSGQEYPSGCYVSPTLVTATRQMPIIQTLNSSL